MQRGFQRRRDAADFAGTQCRGGAFQSLGSAFGILRSALGNGRCDARRRPVLAGDEIAEQLAIQPCRSTDQLVGQGIDQPRLAFGVQPQLGSDGLIEGLAGGCAVLLP